MLTYVKGQGGDRETPWRKEIQVCQALQSILGKKQHFSSMMGDGCQTGLASWTSIISNSTTLDLKATKFDLLCFLQSAFCEHSRPESVYNYCVETFETNLNFFHKNPLFSFVQNLTWVLPSSMLRLSTPMPTKSEFLTSLENAS